MHSEVQPHEKVRFRRGEIASLDELPSALPPAPRPAYGRAVRPAAGALAALVLLVLVVVGAVIAGIGDGRLRSEAQAALAGLLGEDYTSRIGGAGISLDGLGRLAVEVEDAAVAARMSGHEIVRLGYVSFGIRLLPLARGELALGNVTLGDARIELAELPAGSGSGGRAALLDENGLLDPDAVAAAAFDGVKRLFATFGRRDIDRIELEDVEIALPRAAGGAVLHIVEAHLTRRDAGTIELAAELALADRVATLSGEARLDAPRESVESLVLTLDTPLPAEQDEEQGRIRALTASLSGSQADGTDTLTASARLDDLVIGLGDGDRLSVDVDLSATLAEDTNKIEIGALRVSSGRSRWNFHGAFGPTPAEMASDPAPSYRFELVSDGSTIAPAGVPEPSMLAGAILAGHIDQTFHRISVDQIGLRSAEGELSGEAVVTLEAGKSPGLDLALTVDDMPVGEVKQLWPWLAAKGARNWVVSNIFGGRVGTGELKLSVPPGRMGNGVPFGPQEVWGNFTIDGTRFDVAGRIPPVRDGNGSVSFRGTDVDVSLHSGTVYMGSGRTVDASHGELTIRAAHVKPVTGDLHIEVHGTADAVLELARYEPIDVGRFIDLKPKELAGEVQGTVFAEIPLQRGVPVENLDWRVELDYEGLSLDKPFEGQTVTEATGSITVDPEQAVIDAKALLNGAPATLRLVEPLGKSEIERQRSVTLELDDEAREAIVPGLDMLLSGVAEVELDETEGEARTITADLARTTLSIPWVGWSKGSGVPGEVAFTMEKEEDRVQLSDFRLSGETFAATGALSFAEGDLISARFPSAKLNRNDDFSVDVQAKGGGYAITVRGESIDARSVVKLYSKDAKGGTGKGDGGATPVTVDLEVASMSGFHGETFSDVKLSYAGTGARTEHLEFSAVTDTGQQVVFRDRREGDTRNVTMTSADAGAVLRFLDIYEHMEGGSISLALSGQGGGPLDGQVEARDFWIVNEPRLRSIVSTPPTRDSRSLNQAVRGDIDTTRVHFERGFSRIGKGSGYLTLDRGVLRGPLIGLTFQGTFYDAQGNMDMTGTFMPAYGLNRLFGELPIIGQILGNGRDRGLIGITFRLAGDASEPQLEINPLSVIAPGIFRSVFEYR